MPNDHLANQWLTAVAIVEDTHRGIGLNRLGQIGRGPAIIGRDISPHQPRNNLPMRHAALSIAFIIDGAMPVRQ